MEIEEPKIRIGIAGTGLLDKHKQPIGPSVAVISTDTIGNQTRADLDGRIFRESPAYNPEVSALFAFVGGTPDEPEKALYWPVGKADAHVVTVREAEDWLKTNLLAERPVLAAHSRFMVPLQFGKWPQKPSKGVHQTDAEGDEAEDVTYRRWLARLVDAADDPEDSSIVWFDNRSHEQVNTDNGDRKMVGMRDTYYLPHLYKLLSPDGTKPDFEYLDSKAFGAAKEIDPAGFVLSFACPRFTGQYIIRQSRTYTNKEWRARPDNIAAKITDVVLHFGPERTLILEWAVEKDLFQGEKRVLPPLWQSIIQAGPNGPSHSLAAVLDFNHAVRQSFDTYTPNPDEFKREAALFLSDSKELANDTVPFPIAVFASRKMGEGPYRAHVTGLIGRFLVPFLRDEALTAADKMLDLAQLPFPEKAPNEPQDLANARNAQIAAKNLEIQQQYEAALCLLETALTVQFEHRLDERARLVTAVALPGGAIREESRLEAENENVLSRLLGGDNYEPSPFYNRAFLRREVDAFAYNRFAPDLRYLIDDHSFAAIGFQEFAVTNIVPEHMARTYPPMLRMLHMNAAVLNSFSRELQANAAEWRTGPLNELEPEDDCNERFSRIRARFLRFQSLHWFEQVSSQMQGLELFDLLRSASQAERERMAVEKRVTEAQAYFDQRARDRAERLERRQEEAIRFLTIVLPLFGLGGLALQLLGAGQPTGLESIVQSWFEGFAHGASTTGAREWRYELALVFVALVTWFLIPLGIVRMPQSQFQADDRPIWVRHVWFLAAIGVAISAPFLTYKAVTAIEDASFVSVVGIFLILVCAGLAGIFTHFAMPRARKGGRNEHKAIDRASSLLMAMLTLLACVHALQLAA